MIKHTKLTAELQAVVDKAIDVLQTMYDKRQETFFNRSETWQDSEKGEEYSEDTDNLGTVIDGINELYTALQDTFE